MAGHGAGHGAGPSVWPTSGLLSLYIEREDNRQLFNVQTCRGVLGDQNMSGNNVRAQVHGAGPLDLAHFWSPVSLHRKRRE